MAVVRSFASPEAQASYGSSVVSTPRLDEKHTTREASPQTPKGDGVTATVRWVEYPAVELTDDELDPGGPDLHDEVEAQFHEEMDRIADAEREAASDSDLIHLA